jgi:hypothetical protein
VLGSVPALLQNSLSPHALSDLGELTRSSRTSLFSRPHTHTDLYLVSCLKGLICLLQAIFGGCARSCSTRRFACTRFLYVCVCVCVSVCLSVCLPVCQSVCLSVCPSVCLYTDIHVYTYTHIYTSLIHIYVCVYIDVSLCVCVCV